MKYKYTLPADVVLLVDIKGEQVNHPFFILSTTGVLTIKQNYSWNGMTCYPDDKTTYLASLYHDCLYQIIHLKLINPKYKLVADKLLFTTLIANGHNKIKAVLVFLAVSIFGSLFL